MRTALLYFYAVFAGAILGSFVKLAFDRVPTRGWHSLIYPPSTCMCGQPIPWHLNVPILGWLILRGRTQCCKAPLSADYVKWEIAFALPPMLWFGVASNGWQALLASLISWAGLTLIGVAVHYRHWRA